MNKFKINTFTHSDNLIPEVVISDDPANETIKDSSSAKTTIEESEKDENSQSDFSSKGKIFLIHFKCYSTRKWLNHYKARSVVLDALIGKI